MAERRRSVTHEELDHEMLAQSQQLISHFDKELDHEMLAQSQQLIAHFDHRLKDSERVLTWRMVAVNSIAVGISGFVGKAMTDPDSFRAAVAALRSLGGV